MADRLTCVQRVMPFVANVPHPTPAVNTLAQKKQQPLQHLHPEVRAGVVFDAASIHDPQKQPPQRGTHGNPRNSNNSSHDSKAKQKPFFRSQHAQPLGNINMEGVRNKTHAKKIAHVQHRHTPYPQGCQARKGEGVPTRAAYAQRLATFFVVGFIAPFVIQLADDDDMLEVDITTSSPQHSAAVQSLPASFHRTRGDDDDDGDDARHPHNGNNGSGSGGGGGGGGGGRRDGGDRNRRRKRRKRRKRRRSTCQNRRGSKQNKSSCGTSRKCRSAHITSSAQRRLLQRTHPLTSHRRGFAQARAAFRRNRSHRRG
ncbi:hypothetical protein PTSG_05639 [Salpingoeca rosetta]|uniref:Uncharacterized protein n=1 Tax=Salpingoeca rosetta (strain ATCC 50818 / BSB-021) TaxID=946362 RepID=F2UBS9_SALR5|nr:uncharacterized protein PTSG_05639 [Salpingoeca rosetta]EGD73945.1 hypothetical protein PTSG_05639 [Salpingoeca rosetta]|eukprot:XP_004993508.1 hypothetical protein PTSG_05639 [Salpingoeca rosetta]